jgi:glycosyltransferase involved in cell wall biosynthesis
VRVVHFAPAVLPTQTHIYNAIAKLVDLHVVYLSEPNRRRDGQLWTGYDDQWGAEPCYPYLFADTRSFGIGALDLLVVGPRRLSAVLDELNPDVVSVTGWSLASISPILWARKRHIPAVMYNESGKTSGLLRDPVSNAYRRRMLQGCDAYLTVGRAATEFVTQLGAAPDRCVEVWLPSAGIVDPLEPWAPGDREGTLRILWVGRLIKRKRPEIAIEAFGRIAGEINGASLTIVGSGPLDARVRSAAARVGGPIELVGRVEGERLGSIYRRHDVLMVTAVRETWGLVVNEALAHGLYVIASDDVGAAKCLLEDQTGRIVRADDVEAFADALREFVAMRHSRPRGISAAGRIRSCTAEAFAARYVQMLDIAVSRRPAATGIE